MVAIGAMMPISTICSTVRRNSALGGWVTCGSAATTITNINKLYIFCYWCPQEWSHYTDNSRGSNSGYSACNSCDKDCPKVSPSSLVETHNRCASSYSKRLGPDKGLDHCEPPSVRNNERYREGRLQRTPRRRRRTQSCKLGVCLLMTQVPWGGNFRVKTPDDNETSYSMSVCRSKSESTAS
jgi:hypothetical protein